MVTSAQNVSESFVHLAIQNIMYPLYVTYFPTNSKLQNEFKNALSLCTVHRRLQAASMAASSETTSHAYKTASTILLNIKPNQNLALDLDSSHYSEVLKSLIECLCYSLLAQALTMSESVPLIHPSSVYSSANYMQNKG
ncbi:unnamed protein product [Lactuca saligna]|uniref:Uncharacterized protein n=1 Tax=Lactuca saligna TaxID=75948 RepID=A0AA35UW85_LACSI|nr:unnamed protein product [Lactuca saligna]